MTTTTATNARGRMLEGVDVTERRLALAGISTPVLEGGEGPPLVLLHGPGGNATHWARVLPELVVTNRAVAPDLPGHGASRVGGGALDAERVLSWLADLIDETCAEPPALVGHALGGAVAARFAAAHADRVSRLVLVDSLGLVPFAPDPSFGAALQAFLEAPGEETHDRLWRRCALDLDRLQSRMGERWEPFRDYNVDRARTPSVAAAVGSLMAAFGLPPIAAAELDRIAVPVTLIWGRHDLATPLEAAEAASADHGWPLHVIDDCADDPPVEQPGAFLRVLREAVVA